MNLSALEREAVEADQRYRDEALKVMKTPPPERDLTALLEMMPSEDFREGEREYYMIHLGDHYDGPDASVSVVGQTVETLSDVSVRVTTCESRRIQMLYLDGSTGMNAVVRQGVMYVWTRQADGVMRMTDRGRAARTFCDQFQE